MFWALKWFRLQYLKKKERKLFLGPDVDDLINHLLSSCAVYLLLRVHRYWHNSDDYLRALRTRTVFIKRQREFQEMLSCLIRTFRWRCFTTCNDSDRARWGKVWNPINFTVFMETRTHEILQMHKRFVNSVLNPCRKHCCQTIHEYISRMHTLYSWPKEHVAFLSVCLLSARHHARALYPPSLSEFSLQP